MASRRRYRRRWAPPRPKLKRGGQPGVWRSPDERWTFMRHEGDPHPRRWFAYLDDDEYPANEGEGHTSLTAAARWAFGPHGTAIIEELAND